MDNFQKPKTKNIETYAGDMSEAILGGEQGLIKKIIHEQEEKEEEKKKLSKEAEQNKRYTIVGLALVAIGFAAMAVLVIFRPGAGRVEVPPQFEPLIFTDQTEFIDVSGFSKDRIGASIQNKAKLLDLKSGQVAGIYLTEDKNVVGFRHMLELLEASFPEGSRDMVEDNFFIGMHGNDQGDPVFYPAEVFLVLKVKSFVDIFPVLRTWENKMFFDLFGFFHSGTDPRIFGLIEGEFEDGFVSNKNARILYDDVGDIALMYVFVDETSVVITASRAAAGEAVIRLSAGEIRR
jgi:hypothetical protein